MYSAFGIDHGEISKASLWGAGSTLSNRVGAGGMAARKLAGEPGSARFPSKVGYKQWKKTAKESGKRAGQHIGIGNIKGFGAEYHANTGWQAKAQAVQNLPKNKPAPVGMRGPIQSRVKTTKMKARDEMFR